MVRKSDHGASNNNGSEKVVAGTAVVRQAKAVGFNGPVGETFQPQIRNLSQPLREYYGKFSRTDLVRMSVSVVSVHICVCVTIATRS